MSKDRKEKKFFTKCIIGNIPNYVIISLIVLIILLGIYIYFNLHRTRIELESCRSSCSST